MARTVRGLLTTLKKKFDDDEGLFQQGKFVGNANQGSLGRSKQNAQRARTNFNTFKSDPINFIAGNSPRPISKAINVAQNEFGRMKIADTMSRSQSPQISQAGRDLQLNKIKAASGAAEGLGLTSLAQKYPENKVLNFFSPPEERTAISKGLMGKRLNPDEQRSLDLKSIFAVGGLSGGISAIGGKQQIAKRGFSLLTDKKPRFEIDDSASRLLLPDDISGNIYSLKQVLGHDELYKRYPQLADTPITAAKLEPTVDAMWDGSKIVLNENFLRNPSKKTVNVLRPNGKVQKLNFESYVKAEDKVKATVLHEIQHAIQDVEGFAKGGSMTGQGVDAYKKLSGEVEARDVMARMNLTPEERVRIQPLSSQGIPVKDQIVKLQDDFGISQSSKLDPLMEEARKYKSAEEFVKAMGPKPVASKPFLDGTIYKTTLEETLPNHPLAKRFGNAEITLSEGRRTGYFVKGTQNRPRIVLGTTEWDNVGGKRVINENGLRGIAHELQHAIQGGKAESLKTGNLDYLLSDTEIGAREAENLFSKSQLTDIYNQATKQENVRLSISEPSQKIKLRSKTAPGQYTNDPRLDNPLLNFTEVDPRTGKGMGLKQPTREVPDFIKGLESDMANLGKQDIQGINKGKAKQTIDLDTFNKSFDEADANFYRTTDDLVQDAEKVQRAVDSKVSILDYIRTPDRVLKKIGLEKEAKYLRKSFENYRQHLQTELERVRSWESRVSGKDSSERIFQWLDGRKNVPLADEELKVANEIKDYLTTWADKLGLPEDKRVSHYITHIFENDFIQKEFDPEIAALIRDKVPGSVYDPFLQSRLGKQGYVEDTWRALDAYVKRATRKYNMDPALSKLQDSADGLDESAFEYVKQLGDRVNMRPTKLDNLLDNFIKQTPIGYKAGQRPTTVLTGKFRRMIYRSTLGLNVGSAVRNLTQGVNTYATLGEKYTGIGYAKLVKKAASKDLDELYRVGVLDDNIVQDRGVRAVKSFMNKVDEGLWVLFDTVEKINRGSAYFGAKSKAIAEGMSEQQAIEYAKKVVRDTQFTFGSVDTPLVLSGDIAKTLAQFQSFNIKQAELLSEKALAKDWKFAARYIAGTLVMVNTIGELIGMDAGEFIPFFQGRFESPAVQIGKHAVGSVVGEDEDKQRARYNLLKDAKLAVPGGVQIMKSLEGLRSYNEGAARFGMMGSGDVITPIDKTPTNAVRAGVFGQYQLPEVREFFDEDRKALGDRQAEAVLSSSDPMATYNSVIASREREAQEDPSLLDKAKVKLGILPEPEPVAAAELPTDPEDLKTIYKESIKIVDNKKNAQEKIRLNITSFDDEAQKAIKIQDISKERGDALIRIRQIENEHPEIVFEAGLDTYTSGTGVKVDKRAEWVKEQLSSAQTDEEKQSLINEMWDAGVLTTGKKGTAEYLKKEFGLDVYSYTGEDKDILSSVSKGKGGKKAEIGSTPTFKLSSRKTPSVKFSAPQIKRLKFSDIPQAQAQSASRPQVNIRDLTQGIRSASKYSPQRVRVQG